MIDKNDYEETGGLIMIQSRREIRKRLARFLKENFVEAFVDEEIINLNYS